MERTEQLYTLQKQLEFGKKKVRVRGGGAEQAVGWNSCPLLWCFHPPNLSCLYLPCVRQMLLQVFSIAAFSPDLCLPLAAETG